MDPKRKALRLPRLKFQSEYFVFFLPLFFVLHGFTDHYDDIPARDALYLALEYIGFVLLTTFVLALLFQSVRKGAVFTVVFYAFFFFFGALHDWLKEALEGGFLTSYTFLLPFFIIAFGLLVLFLNRSGRTFNRLSRYLNTVLMVLIIMDVVVLAFKPAVASPVKTGTTPVSPKIIPKQPVGTAGTGADIHLIIADEYAGSVELKEVLGFDNSPFEDSLRRRGFFVVVRPRSNYNYTVASMASLFSMNYLPGIASKPVREIYRFSKARINDNYFVDYLVGKGYSIRNFSVFHFAGQPPFAEPYFPQHTELITSTTFYSRVKKDIGYHAALTFKVRSELEEVKTALRWEAEAHSRKMDSVLKEVAAPAEAPRFFYAHFLMPHDPYLYDKDENLLRLEALLDPGKKRDERQLYLQYLQYTNKKLLRFIDRIQKASAKPPIILLLSDHGLRDDLIPVPYHFSNLAAVLLPSRDYKGYYPGFSNTNQLRLSLNNEFGESLTLRNDSCIYLGSKNLISESL